MDDASESIKEGIANPGEVEFEIPTREEMIEEVTALIEDTIGRQENWQSYGGTLSSIRELNGNLIIKTTVENHTRIRELLKQLRPDPTIEEAEWPGLNQDPKLYHAESERADRTSGIGEITGAAP